MLTTNKTTVDLSRASASWLAEFVAKTQGTYASFLTQWETFLTGRSRTVPDASRDDVQDWVGYLQDAGRAPGTIAGAVSTLSSLYRYLVEDEVIDRSPVVRIRRPKVSPISSRKAPDRVELNRLLELAQLDGPRQHLLVCLLGLNGLRVSEALQVKRSALRVDRCHTLLFIIGKGQRPAFVPLAPRTIAALDRVVAMTDAGAEELLLPWSPYAANRTVQSLAKRAGIRAGEARQRCPPAPGSSTPWPLMPRGPLRPSGSDDELPWALDSTHGLGTRWTSRGPGCRGAGPVSLDDGDDQAETAGTTKTEVQAPST
jgi:site-specific recombinase XerD